MEHINTLLGPIHPREMGITAIHEHIMSGLPGWEFDPDFWFDVRTFEKCYHELMDFRLLGGQTYVDCSGIGMGRDLDIYVKLASATQVHIIASTGFGADMGIPPHFRQKDAGYFEELFVRELTLGMGQSRIKAGVIRVGNKTGALTELEEMQYRAAARAALRTGAPIITSGGYCALREMDILRSEGLDPSRIIISHLDSGDCIDVERDKEIARAGAYVSYDRLGVGDWSRKPYRLSDQVRIELVQAMVGAKLQDRMLLSTDSRCCELSWGEPTLHNVGHMLRYFVPGLRQAGISEETIEGILVENPRRVLTIY